MAVNTQTQSKIGAWFANHLADGGAPVTTEPTITPDVATATTGLLGSGEPNGGASTSAPPPAPPPGLLPSGSTPDSGANNTGVAKSASSTPPIPTTSLPLPADTPTPTGNTPADTPQPTPAAAVPVPLYPNVMTPQQPVKTAAPPTTPAQGQAGSITTNNGLATIDPNAIDTRTINPANETVAGQITGLLADNSDYLEGFRDRTARAANARGLVNSTMAASAGEEAAAAGALPIATADAATYGAAATYNVSAQNQALMANMNAYNSMTLQDMQDETQKQVAAQSAAASTANASTAAAASRYNADVSANATRYANDSVARTAADHEAAVARNQADAEAQTLLQQTQHDHVALVNGILNNNDIPPERRAAMLRALGENALADGIFVVDSTGADLTNGNHTTGDGGNGGNGG